MKKTLVLTVLMICCFLMHASGALAVQEHDADCIGSHQEFVMLNESSGYFDTDVSRQICGAYYSSTPRKIILFPSHIQNGSLTPLKVIKPLEGGFAGIIDFNNSAEAAAELVIIPDTYESPTFIGPLEGKLKYVSLPNSAGYAGKSTEMFTAFNGLTFLVVEGSAAQTYCESLGLDYVFRKEYCCYVNDAGQFDAEAFYNAIPDMSRAASTVEEAIAQESPAAPTPLPFTDTVDNSGAIYPFVDGKKWGYLDHSGAVAVEAQFDSANEGRDDLYIVQIGEKHGLIDSKGNMITNPLYDSIEYVADDVYLATLKGQSMLIRPRQGKVIDISQYSDVHHDGNGLIAYFEVVRTDSETQFLTGLLSYDGEVISKPADASYIHYPERKMIGITYRQPQPGAKIIDIQGGVYVDFVENASMMSGIQVPIIKQNTAKNVTMTTVYFEESSHALKMVNGSGQLHCGAAEGYVDAEGNFFPVDQPPANGTPVNICFAQQDNDNHVHIYMNRQPYHSDIFAFPTSEYGSFTNIIASQNGSSIVASKLGLPFYFSLGRAFDAITDMNSVAFAVSSEYDYKHIILHPVSEDGIGLAEAMRSDGKYDFLLTSVKKPVGVSHWERAVMDFSPTRVRAINPFKHGHAVVYDESGKAGIMDAHGRVIADMIYDSIRLYEHYAIAITGDVSVPESILNAGYGSSVISDTPVIHEGTSQVIRYDD